MKGFFRHSRLLLVGSLAAGTVMALSAAPAQAQFFGFWGARSFSVAPQVAFAMPPSELPGIVADEGMRLTGRPYRNGNVYVVDAIDRRGWRHRLIIDAFSGDIVQSFGAGQPGAPPLAEGYLAPERRSVARINPPSVYAIPQEGRLPAEPPLAVPKPKAAIKPPVVARAPVETRPLAPPDVGTIVPQPPAAVLAPAKPAKKPPVVARTPVETAPLATPPVKKIIPQVLPGYAPPAAAGPPPKVTEPAPVAAVPAPKPVSVPPAPAALEPEPAAVAAPANPAVNDVPVTPLYDAPVKPPAGKVNDIPVAPLD